MSHEPLDKALPEMPLPPELPPDEKPRWADLFGIAPDFPDESDARAIRKQVAEEIAQALLDFEANDSRGRADMSIDRAVAICREIGAKETP